MKSILESYVPSHVIYRFDRVEFKKICEEFLTQQAGHPVFVQLSLDEEYIDLLQIELDEETMTEEAEEVLGSLGYFTDESELLKERLLKGLFPGVSVQEFAYMISEDGKQFDILIHIPFEFVPKVG